MSEPLAPGGITVRLPAGRTAPAPILLAIPDDEPTRAPISILAGRGSDGTVLLTRTASPARRDGAAAAGAASEVALDVVLGEHARLELLALDEAGPHRPRSSETRVHLARGSRFSSRALVLGGGSTRARLEVTLEGPDAECSLGGLQLLGSADRGEVEVVVVHRAGRTRSDELYESILGGEARGGFHGLVRVARGAAGSDATQRSVNLLLSDQAVATTRPELDILDSDVRCTHGAAIGRLDEAAIFYLRSRGLGAAEAQRMLLRGFAAEVLLGVLHPEARALLEAALEEALTHLVEDGS